MRTATRNIHYLSRADKGVRKAQPTPLLLRPQSRLNSRNLLLNRQNIRLRPHRRDRKLVDLLMALRIVVLNMRELGRAAESVVLPVAVS